MKNLLITFVFILALLILTSCTDERAIVLERSIDSIDTTYKYRVRTTGGLYDTKFSVGRFQINDTIESGF